MSWFTFPWFRKSKTRPIRKIAPRFRPTVEILEDRLTPATHTWAGPASGGLWSNAANWSGGVPASGETNGTILVFGSGITSTDDISGLTVDQIQFTGSGNVIKGSSGNSLGISNTNILGNNIQYNAGNNLIDSSLSLFTTGSGAFPDIAVREASSFGNLTIASSWLGTSTLELETFGPGTVILSGSSPSFTHTVNGNEGTLEVDGNFSGAVLGSISTTSGEQTTLRGTGTGKSISVTSAAAVEILAPGTPSNTGIMTDSNTLFISGNTSFPVQVQMRVHGFTPGTSYDQLAGGAQLQIGSVSSNPVDLTVDFTGLTAGGTAHIITSSSWNGNKFANVTFNNLTAGLSAQVVYNPADNPNGVDVVVSGGGPTVSTRFVVPLSQSIDNSTTFHDLQSALNTPGLAVSGTVEILQGSTPGTLTSLPSLTGLTVEGDPKFGLLAGPFLNGTPAFTINSGLTVSSAQQGITFKGVAINLASSGGLTFNANGTVTGCNITDNDTTAGNPLVFNGTAEVLENSTLTINSLNNTLVTVNYSGTNTNNLIAGNTFVRSKSTSDMIDFIASAATTVTDQVVGNTFLGENGSSSGNLILLLGSIGGLTIKGNTFSDPGPSVVGISLGSTGASQTATMTGNIIHFSGNTPSGIVAGGNSAGSSNFTITGNVISTGSGGVGIDLIGENSGTLAATVQGNDLHNNPIGVEIVGNSAPISGIVVNDDNFRTFTAAGSSSGAAIKVTGTPSGTINAQFNIFANGVSPGSVVFPQNSSQINLANNLTGNAAFVETLYIDFLHRAGDTTNASDAGFWINQLNSGTMSLAQVANGVLRSSESLGAIVDALYLSILGRPSDSGGRTFWVSFLQQGHTVEQVMSGTGNVVGFFSSPEYAVLTTSNNAYVESLYNKILDRKDDSAGFNFWLSQLPSLGRAGVAAGFFNSGEFRGDAVQQLYDGNALVQEQASALASVAALLPNMLHRTSPPSSAEVNGWVNSGLDLLSLEAAIAGSGEFFTNG